MTIGVTGHDPQLLCLADPIRVFSRKNVDSRDPHRIRLRPTGTTGPLGDPGLEHVVLVAVSAESAAPTMPDSHRCLPQNQAVRRGDQRHPPAVPFAGQRQVIRFRSKRKHRQLEAPLAELRRMTRPLVAAGPTENRKHMIHKPGTVIGKPAGHHNRNLTKDPRVSDPHHSPARRLCPDAPHPIDRNDPVALDLEPHHPGHVTGSSRGRFLGDEQLNLVEPTRQLDPGRRDLQLFDGIGAATCRCAQEDSDLQRPRSESRQTHQRRT